jgi:hypothetical protein
MSVTLAANSGGGNAMHFNGTNSYVDLGTGVILRKHLQKKHGSIPVQEMMDSFMVSLATSRQTQPAPAITLDL